MPVDKSGHRVERMFASIAPRYDLMNHLLSMNIDRYWRRRTVQLAPAVGDLPMLDLCTGTGDLAFAYNRAARGQMPIVAADFCEAMLEVGRRKQAKRNDAPRIEFMQADATALPFDSGHFQLVTVAFGLRNVSDTDQGLREMTRVCRPGGRVAVLEFSMPRWQPLRGVYAWYFRRVLPRLGQMFARNEDSAYSYLPESVTEFPEYEALAQRMRAAGLEEVEFHPLTMGVATLYIGTKPESGTELVPSDQLEGTQGDTNETDGTSSVLQMSDSER